MWASCDVTPSDASITRTATSQRSRLLSAMTTASFSRTSVTRPLRRMPAVSMSRYRRSRNVSGVSTASRVVPGASCTSTRSSPRTALTSEDLPTFGLPMMATRVASGVKIPRGGLLAGAVDLVHGEQYGMLAAPQDAGDLQVECGHARATVHDEDEEARLFDGHHDRVARGRDQVGLGAGVEAARVHHGRLPALEDRGAVEPVAGHARHVVDEGAAASDQAVEKRGLAHVGPADESDDRTDHDVARRSAAEEGGGERARCGFDGPDGHAQLCREIGGREVGEGRPPPVAKGPPGDEGPLS